MRRHLAHLFLFFVHSFICSGVDPAVNKATDSFPAIKILGRNVNESTSICLQNRIKLCHPKFCHFPCKNKCALTLLPPRATRYIAMREVGLSCVCLDDASSCLHSAVVFYIQALAQLQDGVDFVRSGLPRHRPCSSDRRLKSPSCSVALWDST